MGGLGPKGRGAVAGDQTAGRPLLRSVCIHTTSEWVLDMQLGVWTAASTQFRSPSLFVCRMLTRPRLRGTLTARGQSIDVLAMTGSGLAMRCQGMVGAPTHPTATPQLQAVTVRLALAQSAAHETCGVSARLCPSATVPKSNTQRTGC